MVCLKISRSRRLPNLELEPPPSLLHVLPTTQISFLRIERQRSTRKEKALQRIRLHAQVHFEQCFLSSSTTFSASSTRDTKFTQRKTPNMSSLCMMRLGEERKTWRRDHPFGFYAKPIRNPQGVLDLKTWECGIPGKEKTLWEGGLFKLSVVFPDGESHSRFLHEIDNLTVSQSTQQNHRNVRTLSSFSDCES